MISPDDTVFALVALPLTGAALSLCAKAFFTGAAVKRVEYIGVFIGLALPWAAMIHTLPVVYAGYAIEGVVGGWHPSVGIMYRFDGLAWLVNLLGFSVAGAAWVYSLGAGPKGPQFSSVFLIQTAALAATSMTADLFNLFVCLEVMGIASYVLIAGSEKPGAMLAAFSYLMVSATAMVFFLLGIYGLYRLTGALSYAGIAEALAALPDRGGAVASISLSLITAAVAIRVAVMPLYGWLPDSHALAPHAVSAVLSGVLIKTPLFALTRVVLMMPAGSEAGRLMGYAGAVTALAAVVIALSQTDAKRLLAYHTVSQIGYVTAAWSAAVYLGPGSPRGTVLMAAAFLHALYHAMFKGLLFLSVGTTTDAAAERNVYRLRGAVGTLRRAGERIPVTFLTFCVGALAISAIPPFNGFASKNALTYGLKGGWQYAVLFAAGIGTAASFIKLSRIYWPVRKPQAAGASHDSPEGGADRSAELPAEPGPAATPARIHPAVRISQAFLALLCIGTGVFAPFMYRFVVRLFAAGAAGYGESAAFGAGSAGFSAAERIYRAGLVPEPALYSLESLAVTLIAVAGGVAVFLLIGTGPGSRVLAFVHGRPRNFQGLFLAFALGAAGLAGWILYNG